MCIESGVALVFLHMDDHTGNFRSETDIRQENLKVADSIGIFVGILP